MRQASTIRAARAARYRFPPYPFFLVLLALMFAISTVQPAAANPRYAAYVLDTNTGQVLFSRNADARRFPASLTKIMTLYLLFEAMEAGRVSPSTRIPISARAAAEVPTKIGLRAGSTISVDEAIKALIVRSANDIATAVAEFLGGSEKPRLKIG
jgi:D-alanyl-D-alanine carboxypeptidase